MYMEYENMIFWADLLPNGLPRVTEGLVGGQWKPVSPETMTKAQTYGTELSEEEAKEFQGDGWPDESQSPQGEADASKPTSSVDTQQPRKISTESPA